MFRVFSPCSPRIAASSSSLRSSPSFHTSATLQAASLRRRKTRAIEKENLKKRAERARLAEANRPHVVVGHRPGDDAKWSTCDLAKVIITEKDVEGTNIESLPTGEISMPTHFNYGFGEREKEMLFETLPQLTILNASDKKREGYAAYGLQQRHDKADQMQLFKSRMLARIVSLRNANAKGIAYDNRRRIIAEFSEPANPEDTGRPEVQAALLTYKIRNLWEHLQTFKADIGNRRGLTKLVHQRAKILKYLKRTDRDRYDRVLQRLGLEPEAVEGELVV